MPSIIYTKEEYEIKSNELSNAMSILDTIFNSFADEHELRFNIKDDLHYRFIPRSVYDILNYFRFLNEYIKNKNNEKCLGFLDVGCGVGNILLFANEIFRWPIHAFGIERDRKLCLMARQFVGSYYDSEYVFNMDAFNFKRYDKFDIIYYYCPIKDTKLQKKLELLIEKKMKVGAYLIPFLKQDKNFTANGSFKQIDSEYEIYQKVK